MSQSRKPLAGMVTVNIAQGALKGKKGRTVSGNPIVSFLGIPYAQPPVGPLRFKPPQPADSWTGIRDALREGSVCIQYNSLERAYMGNEDCLYLNVYTPKLPTDRSDPLRSVMVWIHGGGFAQGSGGAKAYGPDYLVDQDVVLVTLNYRLGPLGFLSLENEDASGNMGLKDQLLALKWVQTNIASFGGNPKEVTIFGESAGATSVHLHVLSPLSKGLFQRAIVQSGSGLHPWAISRNPRDRAFRLGAKMGCKTKDSKELFEFLKSAEPMDILEAVLPSRNKEEKRKMLQYIYVPSIEPEIPGEQAFLPKDPELLLKEGKFSRVPLILGVTSHEGIMMLSDIVEDPELLDVVDGDFDRFVPESLKPTGRDLMVTRQLSEKIKSFYFGSKSISADTIDKYVDFQTDLCFSIGMRQTLKLHTTVASNVPVYYYQFCFDGQLNFMKRLMQQDKFSVKGACHGDELGYLFKQNFVRINPLPESLEILTIKRMTKLWATFAKTGNPNPPQDEDIGLTWRPHTEANPFHLKIDNDLSTGGEVNKERMEFWDILFRTRK